MYNEAWGLKRICPMCSKSNTPWQRTTFLPLDFSFEIILDKALVEIIFFINEKKLKLIKNNSHLVNIYISYKFKA